MPIMKMDKPEIMITNVTTLKDKIVTEDKMFDCFNCDGEIEFGDDICDSQEGACSKCGQKYEIMFGDEEEEENE